MIYRPTLRDIIRIAEQTNKLPPMAGGSPNAELFIRPNVRFNTNTTTNFTLNSTNDEFAVRFRAPKTGNIAKIAQRVGAIVITGGNPALRGEVWSDDGAGLPSAIVGTGTATITPPVADQMNIFTLSAVAAVTAGVVYHCRFDVTNAAANITVALQALGYTNDLGIERISTRTDGAAWTLNTTAILPYFFIEYDDGSQFGTFLTAKGATTVTTNFGGVEFKLIGFSADLIAFTCNTLQNSGTPDADMKAILMDSANTSLVDPIASIDKDVLPAGNEIYIACIPTAIPANTIRRLVLTRNGGTTGGWIYLYGEYTNLADGSLVDAVAFGGGNHREINGATQGEVAATVGRVPMLGLVFDNVVAAGGGGRLWPYV